jgi:membrane protein DedA with SNARE-associated domain
MANYTLYFSTLATGRGSSHVRCGREIAVDHVGFLFEHIEPLLRDYGIAAVVVILGLESLGLPLPGETVLIFASIFTARGHISLEYLILFAWLAAVVGDNIGYLIGRSLGRRLLLKYGGRIGLNAERFDRLEATFRRYGALTVAAARFIAGLRQLNGVIAGILGMDWRKFLFFNALGGAIWVLVWVLGVHYLSRYVADAWMVAHDIGYIGAALALLVLAGGALYLFRRAPNPGATSPGTPPAKKG